MVTNLRKLIATAIDRSAWWWRKPLHGFVSARRALASREQIRVSAHVISAAPNASELTRAIREAKKGVDALWILNDDQLLDIRLARTYSYPFRPP